jgi:hypothetical protein
MSDNKVPAAAMDISAQPAPAGAARKKGTSPPALSSLPDAVRQAIAAGDFKHCTDAEREQYIEALCATIGISPISRPFGWLKQPTRGGNHNLVCYALKDATEQLRSLRQVSLSILRCEPVADVMMVHVRATLPAVHGSRSGPTRTWGQYGWVTSAGSREPTPSCGRLPRPSGGQRSRSVAWGSWMNPRWRAPPPCPVRPRRYRPPEPWCLPLLRLLRRPLSCPPLPPPWHLPPTAPQKPRGANWTGCACSRINCR